MFQSEKKEIYNFRNAVCDEPFIQLPREAAMMGSREVTAMDSTLAGIMCSFRAAYAIHMQFHLDELRSRNDQNLNK